MVTLMEKFNFYKKKVYHWDRNLKEGRPIELKGRFLDKLPPEYIAKRMMLASESYYDNMPTREPISNAMVRSQVIKEYNSAAKRKARLSEIQEEFGMMNVPAKHYQKWLTNHPGNYYEDFAEKKIIVDKYLASLPKNEIALVKKTMSPPDSNNYVSFLEKDPKEMTSSEIAIFKDMEAFYENHYKNEVARKYKNLQAIRDGFVEVSNLKESFEEQNKSLANSMVQAHELELESYKKYINLLETKMLNYKRELDSMIDKNIESSKLVGQLSEQPRNDKYIVVEKPVPTENIHQEMWEEIQRLSNERKGLETSPEFVKFSNVLSKKEFCEIFHDDMADVSSMLNENSRIFAQPGVSNEKPIGVSNAHVEINREVPKDVQEQVENNEEIDVSRKSRRLQRKEMRRAKRNDMLNENAEQIISDTEVKLPETKNMIDSNRIAINRDAVNKLLDEEFKPAQKIIFDKISATPEINSSITTTRMANVANTNQYSNNAAIPLNRDINATAPKQIPINRFKGFSNRNQEVQLQNPKPNYQNLYGVKECRNIKDLIDSRNSTITSNSHDADRLIKAQIDSYKEIARIKANINAQRSEQTEQRLPKQTMQMQRQLPRQTNHGKEIVKEQVRKPLMIPR
ncbi:MAG: hypothetical protein ACRC42_00290 [Mycoplasma sp.]